MSKFLQKHNYILEYSSYLMYNIIIFMVILPRKWKELWEDIQTKIINMAGYLLDCVTHMLMTVISV